MQEDDFGQTGELVCHRGVGIAPLVKDMAGMLWVDSGTVHIFLSRKGRLV